MRIFVDARIFVKWQNGAWINSNNPNFREELQKLVKQYGQPDIVEFRDDGYTE